MSGKRRSSTTQSYGPSRRAAKASRPVPTAVSSMSVWSSNSTMDWRSMSSSSTTKEPFGTRAVKSARRSSAASMPAVVGDFTRYEKAPCERADWRSSSIVNICTGMCRIAGSDLRLLSTVPAEHIRQVDIERDGVGDKLASQRQAGRAPVATTTLKPRSWANPKRTRHVVRHRLRSPGGMASPSIDVLTVVEDLLSRATERTRVTVPIARSAAPRASAAVLGISGPGSARGRYNVNVLPWPWTLARRISPPKSMASSRLIARPSPVPPYFRDVPASPC